MNTKQVRVSCRDARDLEQEARRQARRAAAEVAEADDMRPDFKAMRRAWECGESVARVARQFAVDPSEVGLIAFNRGWRRQRGVAKSSSLSLSRRLAEVLVSNDVEPAELANAFRISCTRVLEILGPWIDAAPELRSAT